MKIVLIAASLGLLMTANISAKEYIGVNLCSNISPEKITQYIKANGADVADEAFNDRFLATVIKTNNFPIAGSKREIHYSIFNAKLVSIFIKNADDLAGILVTKYGKSTSIDKSGSGDYVTTTYTFTNKADRSATIKLSTSSLGNYLTYSCTALDEQQTDAIVKRNRELDKKQAGESGL